MKTFRSLLESLNCYSLKSHFSFKGTYDDNLSGIQLIENLLMTENCETLLDLYCCIADMKLIYGKSEYIMNSLHKKSMMKTLIEMTSTLKSQIELLGCNYPDCSKRI